MTMFLCFRSQLWLRHRLLQRAYHDLLIFVPVLAPPTPPPQPLLFDATATDDELLSSFGRQLIFAVNLLLSSSLLSFAEIPATPFSVLALIGDAVVVDDMSLAVELGIVLLLLLLALPFTCPLAAYKSPATAFFEFIDVDIIRWARTRLHSMRIRKRLKQSTKWILSVYFSKTLDFTKYICTPSAHCSQLMQWSQ